MFGKKRSTCRSEKVKTAFNEQSQLKSQTHSLHFQVKGQSMSSFSSLIPLRTQTRIHTYTYTHTHQHQSSSICCPLQSDQRIYLCTNPSQEQLCIQNNITYQTRHTAALQNTYTSYRNIRNVVNLQSLPKWKTGHNDRVDGVVMTP